MRVFKKNFSETIIITYIAVLDPDLQIKGGGGEGGGGHPDPEIRGRPGLQKSFSALQASFWSTNQGEPGSPPPSPPGSATASGSNFQR